MYDNAVAASRQLILSVCLLLFHADCFNGAHINAGSAVDAGIIINLGLAVGHADSFAWTLGDTTLAAGAFFFIYLCWHLNNPFLNNN